MAGRKKKTTQTNERKKRGRSVLLRAARALKLGEPIPLEWDKERGEPVYNENASAFATWIGIVVKKYVSCGMEKWKNLDETVINDMLYEITGAFQVPKDRHQYCLTRAATSWRQWKAVLVRDHMVDEETNEVLGTPPSLFPQITQDDWTSFVAYHITDAFKAVSERNKANIAKKDTTWHGSRGGYPRIGKKLREELAAKGVVVDKVDRHMAWLKGHKNKDGEFKTAFDRTVASKIVSNF